ncbi:D-isomer specific 2-hydroxyacid dehydrogenase family protein [Lacticaseibacillus nasuensis]|uniref:D-isomer specific 2-hydroxyacid dehydrogenase family protein n=1 Tax=Lacticaseibacillus nasuensis JCM 17158 TaxID=1291734 RepID=A0A0R1JNC6_9LACO|nr:D-isomer specific 2-hydroxyacid dehydrogenase family protein [Lacticaseibacillus nasuensis]KRK72950.1 D-isomer specific 2-hydroxyacid dehydrogenase family protein [Lacticaseibacillus nasuensis JCM 17158]
MENRIAIVNSSSFGEVFTDHLDRLKAIGPVERFRFPSDIGGAELASALTGFNLIIASVTPTFSAEFFAHKDELKLIARHGIGYNNVDLAAARAHGTVVAIVPALVERNAVAENNITNLLAVMRKTVPATARVKAGKWVERADFLGHGLSNKTVGVIGVGNIGSRLVEICSYGFQDRVLSYDPFKSRLEIEQFGAEVATLPQLLAEADVILLAASLTPSSTGILDADALSQTKPGVYISNAARGALIDEAAMLAALHSGQVAGYAADVLSVEPAPASHPFLQEAQVVVTPHTSAYTTECLRGMGEKCVADVEAVVAGRLPERAVQPVADWLPAE